MIFKLFLLFSVVPVMELSIIIYLGSFIGTMNTVIIVLSTAIVGAYMVRLEGLGVFLRIQKELAKGTFPADELINGAMILVAGALLLTPGFITDIFGFLMVIPGSRKVIRKLLNSYIRKHMDSTHIRYY
jgi:UPF0716 protein FxsA